MADFTVEAKRVAAGNSLSSKQASANSAISQLATLKAQLIALKAAVLSDADYTAEDGAKVQEVIAQLASDIGDLI